MTWEALIKKLIPVDGVRLRIAHGGEQYAARLGLAVNVANGVAAPVFIGFKKCGRCARSSARASGTATRSGGS